MRGIKQKEGENSIIFHLIVNKFILKSVLNSDHWLYKTQCHKIFTFIILILACEI